MTDLDPAAVAALVPYPPRNDGELHPDHVRRGIAIGVAFGLNAGLGHAALVIERHRDTQRATAQRYADMPEPTYGDVARQQSAALRAQMLDEILEQILTEQRGTPAPTDTPPAPAAG